MTASGISVVIPTHNRAGLVVRAVRSAIESCGPDDEIVVADDGSTDNTAEALRPFGNRVIYQRIPHGGAGRARNHGISISSKPLIAFLDSDDEWIPGYLEVKRRLMDAQPELVFCFSTFASRTDSGVIHRRALDCWHPHPLNWSTLLGPGVNASSFIHLPSGIADVQVYAGDFYPLEMAGFYLSTHTLLVRREAAGTALSFAEDLPTYEDRECYGRIARCGPGAYLDCETAWQHRHPGPRLTDADVITRTAARITVLERVWGSDPTYLRTHAREYRAMLNQQRELHLRALLRAGRVAEARAVLRCMEHPPLPCTLLAHLPSPFTRHAIHARGAVRGAVHMLWGR